MAGDRGEDGDRLGHVDDRPLLVTQLAQAGDGDEVQAGLALDLAGEDQHGDGVGEGAEDAIQGVDAAGAGGDVDHSRFAGDAGIAFGGHGAGLLVVQIGAAQARVGAEGVVEEHGAAAGNAEHLLDALRHQPVGDLLGDGAHGRGSEAAVEEVMAQGRVVPVGTVDMVDGQGFVGADGRRQALAIHDLATGELALAQGDGEVEVLAEAVLVEDIARLQVTPGVGATDKGFEIFGLAPGDDPAAVAAAAAHFGGLVKGLVPGVALVRQGAVGGDRDAVLVDVDVPLPGAGALAVGDQQGGPPVVIFMG